MMHPQLIGFSDRYIGLAMVFSASKDEGVAPSSNGRILIVEDEYFVSTELERWLLDSGYEVVGIAVSAEEAKELARTFLPDFILMDIRLAGAKDGVDAALEIFAHQGIRCLFASAHVDAETRQRAQAAQPLGWLSKPYSRQDLVRAVQAATQLWRR